MNTYKSSLLEGWLLGTLMYLIDFTEIKFKTKQLFNQDDTTVNTGKIFNYKYQIKPREASMLQILKHNIVRFILKEE